MSRGWLVLALAATACGAPVYVPKEPPPIGRFDDTGGIVDDTSGDDTPNLPCSGPGSTSVQLTIENRTSQSVALLWLDGSCVEQTYAAIAAGGSYNQPSFDTHVWIVRAQGTQAYLGSIVLDTTGFQTLVIE